MKDNNHLLSNAEKTFKYIIENYVLPLFPVDHTYSDHGICKNENAQVVRGLIRYYKKNNTIIFYPCAKNPKIYYKAHLTSRKVSLALARCVLIRLMESAEYDYDFARYGQKRFFGVKGMDWEILHRERLETAYEVALCDWCGGNQIASSSVFYLLRELQRWSAKTYEGKRVPFGFILDTISENGSFNYLDFMKNNACAVFTDGESANILLDKHGNLIQYQSNEDIFIGSDKTPLCPSRLSAFTNNCDGSRIGVLLLETGDILIIKSKKLVLAKRHSNWVTFNYNLFQQMVYSYLDDNLSDQDKKRLINSLYLTILDISFAHAGGCIAVVKYDDDRYKECIKSDILDEAVEIAEIIVPDHEGMDKISQRKLIIKKFINNRCFFEIPRKLREELVSLDGATVMTNNGMVMASGSIVKIDGGSEEGGRTAATQHMARFGFAVKISEDGQIQCYGTKEINFQEDLNKAKKVRLLLKFA